MIDKIKEKIGTFITNTEEETPEEPQVVFVAPQQNEPDMRIIGLFSDVVEDKIAEIVHAFLYLNEVNKSDPDVQKPIEFYLSTYGGSSDDMFALYDVMRQVMQTSEIHTIGMGKVMSAGVLLLAAGTKGKRQIGKHCRVMIHSAMAGSHGSLPNLVNELEALKRIQEDYVEALATETKMTQ